MLDSRGGFEERRVPRRRIRAVRTPPGDAVPGTLGRTAVVLTG